MSEHKGNCCGQCLWDGVPDKCCCKAIKGDKQMSTRLTTGLGDEVDTSLDDLLKTTEQLGYKKGQLETINRICRVIDDASAAFTEAGDETAADTLRIALKIIGAIYVA